MSEEYSVGYEEGYQAGWNAAIDADAAPVRTKDLTDDEIDALINRAWDKQMSIPEIIRAGIAADREKNK